MKNKATAERLPTQEQIGRRVRAELAARGLTVKAAARAAEIDPERAYQIIRGDRRAAPGELERLAAAAVRLGDRP